MSAGSQPSSWTTVTSWLTAAGVSLGVPLSDLELSNFLRNCTVEPRQFQVRLSPSTCVRLPRRATILVRVEGVLDNIIVALWTNTAPDAILEVQETVLPTPRTIIDSIHQAHTVIRSLGKSRFLEPRRLLYCIALPSRTGQNPAAKLT